MTTAIELARRSLSKILVEGADSPYEADEYADFYEDLNHYMASLEVEGIYLGFTPVTGPEDRITIPPGAMRGLIALMAIEVAGEYGAPVAPGVADQAREGRKTMQRLGFRRPVTSLPRNLPIGSGNWDESNRTTPFYGLVKDARLSFSGNAEPTEFAELSTYVPVYAFWTERDSEGLWTDVNGVVTNPSDRFRVDVNCELRVTASASATYTFAVRKNGESDVTNLMLALVADTETLVELPTAQVELWPGDKLTVEVSAVSMTDSITVVSGELEVA